MGVAARKLEPTFTAAPLTFNREGALAYTGIAPRLFDQLERAKRLTGRPIGPHGEKRYLRGQLDAITANFFGAGTDIDDEFEGLNLGQD